MPAVYLIRHEEAETQGRFMGRSDPPLTARGREAASRKLSALKASVIYVSPMRRARETAEAIRDSAPRIVLPELAEIHFGDWEGLTWPEIEQRWPEDVGRKLENWMGVTPPGGESWPAFSSRVGRALDRILAGSMPAAVVAHIAVNAALAALLTGIEPGAFKQQHGEIIVCEYST